MSVDLLQELVDLGGLEELPTGGSGVRVTLHYVPRLRGGSAAGRRRALVEEFRRFERQLGPLGVVIDVDTVSVAHQTVAAVLAVDGFERIRLDLGRQRVEITPRPRS